MLFRFNEFDEACVLEDAWFEDDWFEDVWFEFEDELDGVGDGEPDETGFAGADGVELEEEPFERTNSM